jgi:hypothetical protein
MKSLQLVRAVVATVALFAAGASASFAQSSAQTAAGVTGRASKDYAPVLPSTLDRAWVIDPRKGDSRSSRRRALQSSLLKRRIQTA